MTTPKDRQSQPDKRSEARVTVPISVQLQIAEQNKQLADYRYNAAVRRGRAWDSGPKEARRGK
jgi:hypothetical protein